MIVEVNRFREPARMEKNASPDGRVVLENSRHLAKTLGGIPEFDDRVFHGFVRR